MPPTLVFCHSPFRKELAEIQAYRQTRGYDGVEWGLDGWRLMTARTRRRQLLDRLRAATPHLVLAAVRVRPISASTIAAGLGTLYRRA